MKILVLWLFVANCKREEQALQLEPENETYNTFLPAIPIRREGEITEPWCSHSDGTKWLSILVGRHGLWPHISSLVTSIVNETVIPDVNEIVKRFHIQLDVIKFSLGDIPPDFGQSQICAANSGRGLWLKVPIKYEPQVDVQIDVQIPGMVSPSRFAVKLTALSISGKLGIYLDQFLKEAPLLGGFGIHFIEQPELNFSLGGSIGHAADYIPKIRSSIDEAITGAIANSLVLPNQVTVPLGYGNPDLDQAMLKHPSPLGVLHVYIRNVKGLAQKRLKRTVTARARVCVGHKTWQTPEDSGETGAQWKWKQGGQAFMVFDMDQAIDITVVFHKRQHLMKAQLTRRARPAKSLTVREALEGLERQQHVLPLQPNGTLEVEFTWMVLQPGLNVYDPGGSDLGIRMRTLILKIDRVMLPEGYPADAQVQLEVTVGNVSDETTVFQEKNPIFINPQLDYLVQSLHDRHINDDEVHRMTDIPMEHIRAVNYKSTRQRLHEVDFDKILYLPIDTATGFVKDKHLQGVNGVPSTGHVQVEINIRSPSKTFVSSGKLALNTEQTLSMNGITHMQEPVPASLSNNVVAWVSYCFARTVAPQMARRRDRFLQGTKAFQRQSAAPISLMDSNITASSATSLNTSLKNSAPWCIPAEIDWLRTILGERGLWPSITPMVHKILEDTLLQNLNSELRSKYPYLSLTLSFANFFLGSHPPTFSDLQICEASSGRGLQLLLSFVWHPKDLSVELKAASTHISKEFTLTVASLSMSGALGIALDQFLPQPPLIGGLGIYFLKQPELQVSFGGIGGIVQRFQFLSGMIRRLLDNLLRDLMVVPNRISIPFALGQSDFNLALLNSPVPFGVLKVTIRSAGPAIALTAQMQLGGSKTQHRSLAKGMASASFVVFETNQSFQIEIVQRKMLVESKIGGLEPFTVADVLQDLRSQAKAERTLTLQEVTGSLVAEFQWMPTSGHEGQPGILALQIEHVKLPPGCSVDTKVKIRVKLGDGLVEETAFATGKIQLVDPILSKVTVELWRDRRMELHEICNITGLRTSEVLTALVTNRKEAIGEVDFATILYIPVDQSYSYLHHQAAIDIISESEKSISSGTLELKYGQMLNIDSKVLKMPRQDQLYMTHGASALVSYAFMRMAPVQP